ncbi:hypothetical protein [Williamsoniiplasma lucivorax]|uniref:Uncharacterized protein n=1 Tax=Williamsoniiplasma lucivorax TaxID=209274 RepID=A0A2S5RFP4_9MOLU|nr:hypothetical protein [Williamsoniiplasma lucivorax]PPE05955.1 hypothetical protein ELUCI_v1c02460 [Williamsoniiplasma lucivorax]
MSKKLTITYMKYQQQNDVVFINGKAGSRKTSWIVNELKNIDDQKYNIFILDPENEYFSKLPNKKMLITQDLNILISEIKNTNKPAIVFIDELHILELQFYKIKEEILTLPLNKIYLSSQEDFEIIFQKLF